MCFFLDVLNVFYFVVLRVCTDKPNIHALRSNVKPEFCNESVLVVRDVKDNSFVSDIIGIVEYGYNFLH